MGILLADFLEMFKNKELHLKVLYISTAVIVLLALIQNEQEIFFYIDIVIMWIILFIGSKIGYRTICIGTIILVAFTNFIIANASDQYVTKEEYNTYFSKEKQELIDQVLEKEDKIVRSNQLDDPLYTINKYIVIIIIKRLSIHLHIMQIIVIFMILCLNIHYLIVIVLLHHRQIIFCIRCLWEFNMLQRRERPPSDIAK